MFRHQIYQPRINTREVKIDSRSSGHLGRHLGLTVMQHTTSPENGIIEFLDPKNLCSDTKLINLVYMQEKLR